MFLKRAIKVAGAVLCIAAAYPPCNAWAGKLTILHSFGRTTQDDYHPETNMVMGPDGALYGTAVEGATGGIIYRLIQNNGRWTEEVLYTFGLVSHDGGYPNSIVVTSDGNIFGTTRVGGRHTGGSCSVEGCGTIFEAFLNSDGVTWTETILHDFKGFPDDGATPLAGLLADTKHVVNGSPTFYGTTSLGGGSGKKQAFCNNGKGYGTLYEMTHGTDGWQLTTLHNFKGTDGFCPGTVPTIDKAGYLYVSTPFGGTNEIGVLARQKPLGTAADLSMYGGAYGIFPFASPDPSGYPQQFSQATNKVATSVIGTAFGGGAVNACPSNSGCGTVYLLSAQSSPKAQWSGQLIHAFKGGVDGAGPIAGLTVDPTTGIYYGVTEGEASPSTDMGTIFALTPSKTSATGYEYSRLLRFNGHNGANPLSNLTFYNGVLYGTTANGGKYAFGTVFSFQP